MGGASGESGMNDRDVCGRPACKEPMNKTLDESRLNVVSIRKRTVCPKPAVGSAEVRNLGSRASSATIGGVTLGKSPSFAGPWALPVSPPKERPASVISHNFLQLNLPLNKCSKEHKAGSQIWLCILVPPLLSVWPWAPHL